MNTNMLMAGGVYMLWGLSAKKVVSYSPGLVDFTIRLVNSVLNLNAQLASEVFWGENSSYIITVIKCCSSKKVFRLIKITVGLVH